MRFWKRLYSTYGLIVFALTFLILLPLFIVTIEVPGWEKYGRKLNRIWSWIFFSALMIRVKFENLDRIEKNRRYILVSNHFSYLDIPVLGMIRQDLVFIGKSSLAKIPLFGYMFRNLHITVDRSSLKSRGETVQKIKEALNEGSTVAVFPEGGIVSDHPPLMGRFKDSAFKVAIEKQIPVIPVTLSYNHLILPDDGRLLLNYGTVKVVIHEPIEVENLELKAFPKIKEACYAVIQSQLLEDNAKKVLQLNNIIT